MAKIYALCNVIDGNTVIGERELYVIVPSEHAAISAALDGNDEEAFRLLGLEGDSHFPPVRITRIVAA